MGNLKEVNETAEQQLDLSTDAALLKWISIAFPNAKIRRWKSEHSAKIILDKVKIDNVDFKNLSTLATTYKLDVEIISFKDELIVTLTYQNKGGNHA